MKFKKHIAILFRPEQHYVQIHLEGCLTSIFKFDEKAEVRIRINGEFYFIQITDMEPDVEE